MKTGSINFNHIKNEKCPFSGSYFKDRAKDLSQQTPPAPLVITGLFSDLIHGKHKAHWYEASSLDIWFKRSKQTRTPATNEYPDKVVFFLYEAEILGKSKDTELVLIGELNQIPKKNDLIIFKNSPAYPYILATKEPSHGGPDLIESLTAQLQLFTKSSRENDTQRATVWFNLFYETLYFAFPIPPKQAKILANTLKDVPSDWETLKLCITTLEHLQGLNISIDSIPKSLANSKLGALLLGEIYSHIPKERETATQLFQSVIKIDPENSYAYRRLGEFSLLEKSTSPRAQSYFHKALKLNKNDDISCIQLAKSYYSMKKFELAKEYTRKSLEIKPNNFEAMKLIMDIDCVSDTSDDETQDLTLQFNIEIE